jgi:hypothetical protein
MPFWPLLFAFIAAEYCSAWKNRWPFITVFAAGISLLICSSGLGVLGCITGVLLTLVFSPFISVLYDVLYRRFH